MAAKRTLGPHQGVMAHRIIYKGVEHKLAIARIEGGEVVVHSYEGEVHSTIFVNGAVEVEYSPQGLILTPLCDKGEQR